METWRVWECNQCGSTLKLNYDASLEDYQRIKSCICGHNGELEWKYNYCEAEASGALAAE